MTTALATQTGADLVSVLSNSIYPGAKRESIRMVLDYCEAAGLDPIQKPVHIVPMWDSKAGSMRDVVMPGIGLYRVQAARTGQYAGVSEPEFGPDVTETVGGAELVYPEWCRVTVRRQLESGHIAEFTAKEYWLENYAVRGGKDKSVAPNAMWTKRPRGQLAKCATAQALRSGFPEIGSVPTADEMEGRELDPVVIDHRPAELPPYPHEQFTANSPLWAEAIGLGKTTAERIITTIASKYRLSLDQRSLISALGSLISPLETTNETR